MKVSALLLASAGQVVAANQNAPSAKVEFVGAGAVNGQIATTVSWANCIDPDGIESVQVTLTIQPADGTKPVYTKLVTVATGLRTAPINPTGSQASTIRNLTSGDAVKQVDVAVFPFLPVGAPMPALLQSTASSSKAVNIVIP